MNRRKFIEALGLSIVAAPVIAKLSESAVAPPMPYETQLSHFQDAVAVQKAFNKMDQGYPANGDLICEDLYSPDCGLTWKKNIYGRQSI